MWVPLTGVSLAIGESVTTVTSTSTITGLTTAPVNFTAFVLARASDKPCAYSTTRMQGIGADEAMSLDIVVQPFNASSQPAVVDFYIFNDTQFKTFEDTALSTGDCAVGGAKVQIRGVLKYHVDFTSSPGDVFVFVNLSLDRVGLISITGSVTVPFTGTVYKWQASAEGTEEARVIPLQISQLLMFVGFMGLIGYVVFRIIVKRRTTHGVVER